MKRFLFAIVLLGFLGIARGAVPTDKPLDLKFTAVDGKEVDLAKLRGKVVLVDFWATWCPPCVIISPDIVNLYKKYHAQGLEIVGISMDSDKKAMLNFVKKEGAPWPQYFEDSDKDNVIAVKYGVDSFPTVWLINKQGIVVDPDFRDMWAEHGGIPTKTPAATIKKIEAAIEKQLKAP